MRISVHSFFVAGLMLTSAASAQATQPADDAAPFYLRASTMVQKNYDANIEAPAASNLDYAPYPPFSSDWLKMEKADFDAGAPARALAHQARSIDRANWPSLKGPNPVMYLNGCRGLANELADAALYQHLQGDDAAAVETIRDLLHLADLMENHPDNSLIQLLVGIGIRELALDRLEVIASSISLADGGLDIKPVQTGDIRQLISQLLSEHADDVTAKVLDQEKVRSSKPFDQSTADKLIQVGHQTDMECGLTVMSLGCQLYRLDHHGWPKSANDLKGYIASIPIDPFGDGKQALGYALIKGSLPDGSDRPLVYSRMHSKDGLFFFNDQPHYSYYSGVPTDMEPKDQKQGGQFRDVSSWAPNAGQAVAATTQPLN